MSYITAAPIQEGIICDEAISLLTSLTVLLTANNIYLYFFKIDVPTTFSGGKFHTGTTATGTVDLGIYSFAGTLLTNTGAIANVASSNMSPNFSGGNYTLAPGQYFMAMCPSNSTDTIGGRAGLTNSNGADRWRLANNSGTAGVLNPAHGGYTDNPNNFPAFALTIVGGLT